jgi:hypothetical protein
VSRHRKPEPRYLNVWDRLDEYAHRHPKRVPGFLARWFCDRLDKSLGLWDTATDEYWD